MHAISFASLTDPAICIGTVAARFAQRVRPANGRGDAVSALQVSSGVVSTYLALSNSPTLGARHSDIRSFKCNIITMPIGRPRYFGSGFSRLPLFRRRGIFRPGYGTNV